MPQMSPMWWTTIFVMSISTLMMMITFTYFLFENKLSMIVKNNKVFYNWKW